MVVHGWDGLDEITITTGTKIGELRDGRVRIYEITPEEFNLKRAPMTEIAGGDLQPGDQVIVGENRPQSGGQQSAP